MSIRSGTSWKASWGIGTAVIPQAGIRSRTVTKPMKAARERPYSREEVGQIVQSVMSGMGTEADMRQKMRGELESLRESIDDMRAELAQMRAADIGHKHIPAAADELDAVLGETASATGVIMDACEKI